MADSRERIRGPSRGSREFLANPRQVLRKLMLLCEGRQYREAASVIQRLGTAVLKSIITELPVDLLLEQLPYSAYLLEAFYLRLLYIKPELRPKMPTETIMWQLVKLFSNSHEENLKQRCHNLIQALVQYNPNLLDILREMRKSFIAAVRGLGVQGLINHTDGELMSLHLALKTELQIHVDVYKEALHKLEELNMMSIKQDPAFSSHQRLLAINYKDIQQRLIDNKTVLTILDKPALKPLSSLIENLTTRVNNDKETLKCVAHVKRIGLQVDWEKMPSAGLLMNFEHGCEVILDIMGNAGNAPAITEISSIKFTTINATNSSGSCSEGYHSDDSINKEIGGLIIQYRDLYIINRADTLEVLDSIPQLKNLQTLTAKILFSVIVLSFRLCHGMRERKVLEVRRILQCPLDNTKEISLALDRGVRQYLYGTIETFPLGEIERTVFNQVLSTLYEYPCLNSCPPLTQFVSSCVRLSWSMVNQKSPYYLDNDFNLGFLHPEKHARHLQADRRSDLIKQFLWPALMQNSCCVFKAIVAT